MKKKKEVYKEEKKAFFSFLLFVTNTDYLNDEV